MYTHPVELSAGKWGNSIAVRLPRNLAEMLGVSEGGALMAEETAGGVLLRSKRPVYRLDDLLEGMNEENSHGEIAWGGVRGNEVW
ncbi:AbrB/MazE/SpoVT family DNA-binding domain-containing protein [bacterium]|nr:MAG: AbrB/MazE/SpoVT family DNA-binding domain-containing protein [bacterium]